MPSSSSRRIVVLAFPDAQILDAAGPSEAFAIAERIVGGAYAIELISPDGGEIETSGKIRLLADGPAQRREGPIDTLIVAGGLGVHQAAQDESLLAWLQDAASQCRRIASVCTGAFLLAAAGLLDGRRATTHWAFTEELSRRHPLIDVQIDPIFVRDGNVWTSAGVTSGIDLALALIEQDLGSAVSLKVAKTLVLFVRRPGGQAQFSASLSGQPAQSAPLRELQDWIVDNLAEDLSVAALSRRVFMSERNFARVFAAQTGITPGRYVESLRVERAKLLLTSTSRSVEDIASGCGFGTVETLRRSFARALCVSPGAYRERFRGHPHAAHDGAR